jgi:hypothetical protein
MPCLRGERPPLDLDEHELRWSEWSEANQADHNT